jgi:beta-galactosidase
VTEFIAWQADIVRAYARTDQFVSTCIAYDRPAVADDDLTRGLDVATGNPYYAMQDRRALPASAQQDRGQHWASQEPWTFYRVADRMYSSRQEPFSSPRPMSKPSAPPESTGPATTGSGARPPGLSSPAASP